MMENTYGLWKTDKKHGFRKKISIKSLDIAKVLMYNKGIEECHISDFSLGD